METGKGMVCDLVKIHDGGAWLLDGAELIPDNAQAGSAVAARLGNMPEKEAASQGTMSYGILEAHNQSGDMKKLRIKFDAMASHDITYVGIIQTARASGLKEFPLPYVLTNCHNSLCAVGGTINEDDHVFGLTAAQKYGGIYVPAHQAVIHQYMREQMAGCGKMILGSDSHTRYGALGTMAIGEGGPELVKQLLCKTYDIDMPDVVAVHLTGSPRAGVGPQDVALAIIGAVFSSGAVKNKVLEFIGDGIANLSVDYRIGIDVMTTETTCLSSIWATDDAVKEYLTVHGRPQDYSPIAPKTVAYYDGLVSVDLSKVEPMIALPFHPSNTYTIAQLSENLEDILAGVEKEGSKMLEGTGRSFTLLDKIENGKLHVQQGVIAGCAGGTYENINLAAQLLDGKNTGQGAFWLSVYPSSQPVNLALVNDGSMAKLMRAGASIRTAFCGPCFGAGDVPANNALSVRHTTRNFPSREGSKPGEGQISSVALMDARSIAATALNGGVLTAATEVSFKEQVPKYFFDRAVYDNRLYQGAGKPDPSVELQLGPNITDWPKMQPLANDLLLGVVSVITDPVTTTDELIPSGETSSYRSNPLRLAEFALSRKDPAYVGRAKAVQELENARLEGNDPAANDDVLAKAVKLVKDMPEFADRNIADIGIGSLVYAVKPGDGSAREQAASCQKVLGTFANMAQQYATKRYRSNLINWGMLPFVCEGIPVQLGEYVFVPDIREAVQLGKQDIPAYVLSENGAREISLSLQSLTEDEKSIILAGCLINFYATTETK